MTTVVTEEKEKKKARETNSNDGMRLVYVSSFTSFGARYHRNKKKNNTIIVENKNF